MAQWIMPSTLNFNYSELKWVEFQLSWPKAIKIDYKFFFELKLTTILNIHKEFQNIINFSHKIYMCGCNSGVLESGQCGPWIVKRSKCEWWAESEVDQYILKWGFLVMEVLVLVLWSVAQKQKTEAHKKDSCGHFRNSGITFLCDPLCFITSPTRYSVIIIKDKKIIVYLQQKKKKQKEMFGLRGWERKKKKRLVVFSLFKKE